MKIALHLGGTWQTSRESWAKAEIGVELEAAPEETGEQLMQRLYGELQPHVRRIGAAAQRLGRLPTPAELAQAEADEAWTGRRCDSCGAPIVWLHTSTGAHMPVLPKDKDGKDVDEREVYDKERHRTHWADCPHAAEHRRRAELRAKAEQQQAQRPQRQAAQVPAEGPAGTVDLQTIQPYLDRLAAIEKEGSESRLDGLRAELTALSKDALTRPQRELLARAIKDARTAIRRRREQESQQIAALAVAAPRELHVERDPDAEPPAEEPARVIETQTTKEDYPWNDQ